MSDWRYSVVSIVGGYCVVLVGHSCSTPPDCGSLPLLPHASQMLGNKNPDRVANRMHAVHVVGSNRAGSGQ